MKLKSDQKSNYKVSGNNLIKQIKLQLFWHVQAHNTYVLYHLRPGIQNWLVEFPTKWLDMARFLFE
ncbi:hypothetical protein BpHYR1_026739 [Brachionus plicatilis]|uniref:Uncharacterized protein n=1 Tax=Brachionus plicatilis TaxID=10195 RepID=A0A3M7RGC7_BRAPC|nr:hypothetical protein BpHYR1_026739 [Brachionus plicatilis]